MSEQQDAYTEPRHSIGVVCRRTGLKPDLLRAWQRRYGAVEPERTSGNQRLYSEADIERLQLLHEATEAGHRISHVADLSNAELLDLLERERRAGVGNGVPLRLAAEGRALDGEQAEAVGEECLRNALAAVQQLDAAALRQTLDYAAARLQFADLVDHVLLPLVEEVGELWEEGGLNIVHEHLATAAVRTFVASLERPGQERQGASRIIVATPARQVHELGSLLAAASASAAGWNVTYLGPDLPAAEIAAAVRQHDARALGLSIVYPKDDPKLPDELRRLRRHIGNEVKVFVGGRAAESYADVIDEVGAVRFEDLEEFREGLRD